MLLTPEGKSIHGWFFLYIFWEYCEGIKEYQVVQKSLEKIVIRIVPDEGFDEMQLDRIREVVARRGPGRDIEFQFVDEIDEPGRENISLLLMNMKK